MSQLQPQPQPQPWRTGDSLIFGVPARLCQSGDPRFRWNIQQVHTIIAWMQANPESYDNLQVLLASLDLHGYGPEILGLDGQSIAAMIEKKVRDKICKLRRQLSTGWEPAPIPAEGNDSGASNKKRKLPSSDEEKDNKPDSKKAKTEKRKANTGSGNTVTLGCTINIINP